MFDDGRHVHHHDVGAGRSDVGDILTQGVLVGRVLYYCKCSIQCIFDTYLQGVVLLMAKECFVFAKIADREFSCFCKRFFL